MKVQILKGFKHSDPSTNALYVGIPEEVWFVSDDFGKYGCKMGWFKDLSGLVPTESPKKDEVILAPNSTVSGNSVEDV